MNNRINFFVFLSIVIHIAVFLLFYDYIALSPDKNGARDFDDDAELEYKYLGSDELSLQNKFSRFAEKYFDKATVDSLWRTDKAYLSRIIAAAEEPGASRYSTENTGKPTRSEIRALLARIPANSRSDTLLAYSELLRTAVENQLRSDSLFPLATIDWDQFGSRITEYLRRLIEEDIPTDDSIPELQQIFYDAEMVRLWHEALMQSIYEIGIEKLLDALEDAISIVMDDGKPAPVELPCRPGQLSGIASTGSGGRNFGIELNQDKLADRIREEFLRLMGPLLSQMAVKGDGRAIGELLTAEANARLGTMMGNDSLAQAITDRIGFERIMLEAAEKEFGNGRLQQAEQALEAFEKGLGGELGQMLEYEQMLRALNAGPNRMRELADRYWEFLKQLAATPNLLMPNLEKYAEAALSVRNRALAQRGTYDIDRGVFIPVDHLKYRTPETILLPPLPEEKDSANHSPNTLEPPSFASHAFGGSVRREQPIVIDGTLGEWDDVGSFKLVGEGQGMPQLPPDFLDCNYLLSQWDNRGLYFAYTLRDKRDNECLPELFWDTDALELFIDPQNYKDSLRFNGRSYQFWAWPRAPRDRARTGESVFFTPHHYEPRLFRQPFIQCASRRRGNEYTCEVFVDRRAMEGLGLLPGNILGFNYSINNGEEILIRWVTNMGKNVSIHPNLWGDLLLMGTDAHLSPGPEKFVLPGANIEITVTDHDMNLFPDKQDKVWVRIKSLRTGDLLPLGCMETGENSGVFVGRLGTIFGSSSKDKYRISVQPGDVVEAYYLDQHAFGGKSNVKRVVHLPVGRGMMRFAGGK